MINSAPEIDELVEYLLIIDELYCWSNNLSPARRAQILTLPAVVKKTNILAHQIKPADKFISTGLLYSIYNLKPFLSQIIIFFAREKLISKFYKYWIFLLKYHGPNKLICSVNYKVTFYKVLRLYDVDIFTGRVRINFMFT